MESDEAIGVYPPGLQNPLWRIWLDKQDASLRKFISEPAPGYWRMSSNIMPRLLGRCLEVGWVVSHSCPHFLFTSVGGSLKADPFGVFFLKPNAPKELVDVVYRFFIKKVHTDIGGDEEMAVLYNSTRDDIYKLKGW